MSASSTLARKIAQTIADEIGAQRSQVESAVGLLDEGATVPFIARYRKEVTGGLDDTQLRNLETRLTYLRELEDRRAAVLASIQEQGKLTDELHGDILAADTKSRLEDLYLPYKPKRRTRAQIAREAGLEPLADGLIAPQDRERVRFSAQGARNASEVHPLVLLSNLKLAASSGGSSRRQLTSAPAAGWWRAVRYRGCP